jgi:hypothetical protein
VRNALPQVAQIPLGGTAVGNGLNTHPEFAERIRARLAEASGLTIDPPEDPFEAQANRDALVELSGALKVVAVSLIKIAQDLALMGSGPRAGIGEIFLPELQKGSSIMPGKVNPVLPEVVMQVGAQVIGNDVAITIGGLQGNFELNVRIPLIARNLLGSIHLLSTASRLFADKCVSGIEANLDGCKRSSESTLAAATALNPFIGYDKGAAIVKEAATSGRMLREVALEHGVDAATFDEAMDLRKMARGSAARTDLAFSYPAGLRSKGDLEPPPALRSRARRHRGDRALLRARHPGLRRQAVRHPVGVYVADARRRPAAARRSLLASPRRRPEAQRHHGLHAAAECRARRRPVRDRRRGPVLRRRRGQPALLLAGDAGQGPGRVRQARRRPAG